MRVASLPWYDLREVQGVHDRLWTAIADRLRAVGIAGVPDGLDRDTHYAAQWRSGRLLLGQACGFDVANAQSSALRIVATPVFEVEGCEGAGYRSFVVVRRRDPARRLSETRGYRCVINTETSHSGMNALRSLIAPLGWGFYSSITVSGAHERSVEAVASGRADVAAIDCISWRLLQQHRPAAIADLRILCMTALAPAPPFVTSATTPEHEVQALRGALQAVLSADRSPARALGLRGIAVLGPPAYASMDASRRRHPAA